MFIATANLADLIPGALRDRMEIIRLAGYTDDEKRHIARRYLLPRQLREHGLSERHLRLSETALTRAITAYTREAGLRNLERELATICRKIARHVAEGATAPSRSPRESAAVSRVRKYHLKRSSSTIPLG
jgi:ATP-dependent Lon protease